MNLRLVQPSEDEELLGWVREYFTYDGILFEEPRVREGLSLLLQSSNIGWAWFIERQGQNTVLGYAIATLGFDLEFGGKRATLTDLYIKQEFRGKGLGRLTLNTIETECRKSGCLALELQVENDNLEAQRLYRAAGFIAHDRTPMSKRLN